MFWQWPPALTVPSSSDLQLWELQLWLWAPALHLCGFCSLFFLASTDPAVLLSSAGGWSVEVIQDTLHVLKGGQVCPSSSSASCGRAHWDNCQAGASCSHTGLRRWPLTFIIPTVWWRPLQVYFGMCKKTKRPFQLIYFAVQCRKCDDWEPELQPHMYTCTFTTCWIINSCIYRSEDWCLQDTERLQCYHGYCTQTDWIISMTLQHDTSQLLYVNVHKWHSWSSSDLCISYLYWRKGSSS